MKWTSEDFSLTYTESAFFLLFIAIPLEAELAPKREVPPGEATALEALLRGDGLLEKKSSLCKEEETMLEIQVRYYTQTTLSMAGI